jgi:hypothetical protein
MSAFINKILFINHGISHSCGVNAQGRRHFYCLSKSEKFDFIYCEPQSFRELKDISDKINPLCIIYNYMPIVLPWVNEEIHSLNTKHVCVVHNITPHLLANNQYQYGNLFNNYITLDSSLNVDNKLIFKTDRPLYELDAPQSSLEKNTIIKIGTFGFPFVHKGFHKLVEVVNAEFDNAVINLHMSDSHFCNNETSRILSLCAKAATKPNIKINYTHHYRSEIDMVKYLNKNHINALLYDNIEGAGVSAAIDYLISAQRPILISNSQQFRNFHHRVCVFPRRTLRSIVENYDQEVNNIKNIYMDRNKILKQTEEIIEIICQTKQ